MQEEKEMTFDEVSLSKPSSVLSEGVKVITGTQKSLPIKMSFYHSETFELMLIRDLDELDIKVVRLFGTFELGLLDPSYIHFLSNQSLEEPSQEAAQNDMKYFIHMINLMSKVMESLALKKELVKQNIMRINLKEVIRLRINTRGNLEIKSKDHKRLEITSKIDLAGLSQSTLEQLSKLLILVCTASRDKTALNFKLLIEKAISMLSTVPEKPTFVDVKEEEVSESEE